ncbi:MAG: hypothetical protein QOH13_1878 [Thermoleophilaceae bacterium]|nr:hypothetical protein [Thermoleophilaceae bacterium]
MALAAATGETVQWILSIFDAIVLVWLTWLGLRLQRALTRELRHNRETLGKVRESLETLTPEVRKALNDARLAQILQHERDLRDAERKAVVAIFGEPARKVYDGEVQSLSELVRLRQTRPDSTEFDIPV